VSAEVVGSIPGIFSVIIGVIILRHCRGYGFDPRNFFKLFFYQCQYFDIVFSGLSRRLKKPTDAAVPRQCQYFDIGSFN